MRGGIVLFDSSKLDATYLKKNNNLSDVDTVATARTNLGLASGGTGDIWVEKAGDTVTGAITSTLATGTAPFPVTSTTVNTNFNADMIDGKHIGTSGNAVPLLDGTNTFSGVNTFTSVKTTAPLGYAEMYMYGNTTPVVIDTTNLYHAVYNTFGNNDATLPPLIDTTYWTYKAGATYAVTSVTDPGGGTTITCVTAGHSLLAGEPVTITGSSVAGYNGTYLVLAAGLTGTAFRVTVAYSATATASARKPATLKSLVAGTYEANFTASGTVASPNDNVKVELNRDTTALDNIGARGVWDNTKYSSIGGSGLVSVTVGQYIWMSTKNYSSSADITFYSANVSLHRIL